MPDTSTYALRILARHPNGVAEVLAVFHSTDLLTALQKADHASEDGMWAQVFDVTRTTSTLLHETAPTGPARPFGMDAAEEAL